MTNDNVNWLSPIYSNTLTATTSNDFTRVIEKLDVRQPVALRIKRVNVNSPMLETLYICIDNIRVSPPPADIEISKPTTPFDIGYPSVNTLEGRVQCWIDNRPGPDKTSYSGGTRTNVQVVSRWNYIPGVTTPQNWNWISPWQTNTLECIDAGNGSGDGEKWGGAIPPYQDVGILEYYFRGEFNGARYQSPDYTERGWVYQPESPSPKIYSAVLTTNAVGATTMVEPFRAKMRPFHAAFGEVVAVVDQIDQLGLAGQFPDGVIPMYLSGTHEWQARISVVGTSISNITWYFKGSGEYSGNYTLSTNTEYWCNQTGVRVGVLTYGYN
jgi:hypothetical protein